MPEGRHHVLTPGDLVSFGPRVFRVACNPVHPTGSPLLVDEDVAAAPLSGVRVREREREELALAAEIRRSFLPRPSMTVEGLELSAHYRPAQRSGGDFYDAFWVAPKRLAVVVGDVSGEGVAGALSTARIASELRSAALAHVEPRAVLMAMNEATLARDQPDVLFTSVYLTFDVDTGDVVLANAGHPPPYFRHESGMVAAITSGRGDAVGMVDEPGIVPTRLRLDLGDSLVLYTDGLVEAASADGMRYGNARLEACLRSGEPRMNVIAQEILRSVDRHAGPAPAKDDVTLVICRRSPGLRAIMQPRRVSRHGA